MVESKKSPSLRFKGFTDAWEQRKLGNIANITSGGTPKRDVKEYWENGSIPWVTTTEVHYQTIKVTNEYITQSAIDHSAAKIIPAGSIVMAMYGQGKTRGQVGKLGVSAATNQANANIEVYNSSFTDIVYYQLEANYLLIRKMANEGGQANLSLSIVKGIPVSIPSTDDEASKVAGLLLNLSNLIAHHQRKLELLINLRRSLSQNMFPQKGKTTPNIRFIGFTDNWVQHQLGNIGDTYSGLSGKTKKDFGHGDAEYVTYMNVFTNPVSDPEMTEQTEIDTSQNLVKRGDVFFTVSSETPEEVGMSSVWLSDKANVYLNSFCFGFRPTLEINSYFLSEILRAQNIRSKMMILAQGISRFNISKNKVMKLSISFPTTPEQEKIGRLFKTINDDLFYYQRKLESFKQLKQALLQKMFV